MGDVGDFFQDIIDGVGDFFEDVVDELEDIIDDIGDFFEEYWEELLAGTLTAVLIFTPVGGIVLSGLSEMAGWIQSEAAHFIDEPLEALSGWTMSVQDFWYNFSEFTHLNTILAVHNIASIVSPEYNQMVQDFYKTISDWSYSFGAGALGVASLIQNTRTLVFDVSSTFGMSYDMCELVWVNDLAKISQMLGEKTTEYANNPSKLILDLQESIQRPKIDAKQGFMGSLYGTIEATINLLDATAGHLETLAQDVYRLFAQLPEFVETDWTGDIIDASEDVIEYIELTIHPKVDALKMYIDSVWTAFVPVQTAAQSLSRIVQTPGTLLQNTSLLPEPTKTEEYKKIYEETNKQLIDDLPNIEQEIQESFERLEAIQKALDEKPPEQTQLPTEMQGLSYPVGSKPIKRKSWNVGEY